MSKTDFLEKLREKPVILLAVLLTAFFLKEVFLADIFPMFTGQDEARHYNSVQYAAYPKLPEKAMSEQEEEQDKDRLETYRFSEEIKNTVVAAGLNANRENSFNKMSFAPDSYAGENEKEINDNHWAPLNKTYPPDAVANSLYHKLASYIENALSEKNILIRFYAARLFSILLGTLAVFFFYLTFKNFGFSEKATLAMTAIAAFQPRFSIYYSNVNYDALLIFCFAVFSWAGTLLIKNGASWKNILPMAVAALVGYFDKGTGIILIAAFIFMSAWALWQKFKDRFNFEKKQNRIFLIALFSSAAVLILFFFGKYLPFGGKNLAEIFSSLDAYLSKTLTPGRLALTARTYWGTLGWTNSALLDKAIDVIRFIELISFFGLVWFLFSKKIPEYLPEKKYVWFAVFMVSALQLGIRVADWKMFSGSGTIILGTPGRYFIPNLALHIALVSIGLGMLLRKKERFENILSLSTVLMFSFITYLIFNVIIFRFYL